MSATVTPQLGLHITDAPVQTRHPAGRLLPLVQMINPLNQGFDQLLGLGLI